MLKFAVIAEGILDQVVLERIITTIFKNKAAEKILVNPVQPERDASDESKVAQSCFGGWEGVIDYCSKTDLLNQALEVNDYLIIHIDTDVCGHKNFNLPIIANSTPAQSRQLILDVESFLSKVLAKAFFNAYKHRIIFAVAVHSTECWFLPAYSTISNIQSATSTCESKLNTALAKKNIHFEKDYEVYLDLSRCFRKHADLITYKKKSSSLGEFVDKLLALSLAAPPTIIYRRFLRQHHNILMSL